jgi:phospholipid transport system substrate-binding protein
MAEQRLGIIMHGVTGRMGYNQHLVRSILAIRDQGGLALGNGDRLVRTKLVRPNDAPVQLNYLLRQSGGEWRIVDLYLTGSVSELASRRSEFTAILREGGPDRLLAELRQRTATLLR